VNGCCFRACCTEPLIGSTAGDIALPLAVAALALTAGLTVVAFVKAVGIGFLGRPRSESADEATEVPRTMRVAVGLLVAVCVVLGVAPTLIFPAVERAVRTALPGLGTSRFWLMASTCRSSGSEACWHPRRWPVPWPSPWSA
jgi:formate hydrogenlyase subunit 3/multisubunit Na+/H+ antiporter MnhD subunit